MKNAMGLVCAAALGSVQWCGNAALAEAVEGGSIQLSRALSQVAEKHHMQFMYVSALTDNKYVASVPDTAGVEESLEGLLKDTGLRYEFINTRMVRIFPVPLGKLVAERHVVAVRETPASPQQATTDTIGLEEIVVTAQRREQRLQDVPASVNVVSGEQLAGQGIRSLEDFSAQQPNLRIATAPASEQLRIRGSGSGFNAGFEQSVATFVDGTYRSRSRSAKVALFDIERVEVLRGPQTIFFGANAIAGALNVTTRKPKGAFEANVLALYSPSDGEYNLEGGVSMPVSDTLGVRFAGRRSGMDGYVESPTAGLKGPHLNDRQFRISGVWEPNSVIKIDARVDVARQNDKNTILLQLVNCPPATSAAAGLCARTVNQSGKTFPNQLSENATAQYGGSFTNDMDEYEISGSFDLGPVSLISTTAYQDQSVTLKTEVAPYPVASPLGTVAYVGLGSGERFRQASQELRLQSNSGSVVEYIAGIYYEKQNLNAPVLVTNNLRPLGQIVAPVYNAGTLIASLVTLDQESRTWSGFASLTYKARDWLKFTGSLRYSSVTKDGKREAVIGSGNGLPDLEAFVPGPASVQAPLAAPLGQQLPPFPVASITAREWMPSFSVVGTFSPDVSLYASYTRGFKAGGFSGNTADVFAPEYVNAYETGIKARWFERRLTTNLSLFRSNYKGLQDSANVSTPSGALLSVVSNVGASRSQGIEFDGVLEIVNGLRLRTDIAYLDARYLDFPNAPCSPAKLAVNPGCRLDLSGKQQSFAPKWSGSVGLDYATGLRNGVNMELGAVVTFVSSFFQQTTDDPLLRQSGYAKLNLTASLGFLDDRLKVALLARNVTDKLTAGFRNYAAAAPGSAAAFIDRPRSIALQTSYRW